MTIYLKFSGLLIVSLMLSACGPMAVVGAVGNVVNAIGESTVGQDPDFYTSEPTTTDPATGQPVYDNDKIAETNVNIAIEFLRKDEYQKSLGYLDRAKAAKPEYPLTYTVYGLVYQRLEKPEVAEVNFQHALELDEKNPDLLNNYAQFLCQQNRRDEAEKYFLKAADNPLYKTPEIPYTNFATCALIHDDVATAEEYYKKALAKNPNVSIALMRMAQIEHDRQNYVMAHDYMDRYNKYSKHTPESLWLGIQIEKELGNKDVVSSYALLLRNKYPKSEEARLLAASGIR